jgi:membrane carboxypeptidase/penicillin-binding protein PbpC
VETLQPLVRTAARRKRRQLLTFWAKRLFIDKKKATVAQMSQFLREKQRRRMAEAVHHALGNAHKRPTHWAETIDNGRDQAAAFLRLASKR